MKPIFCNYYVTLRCNSKCEFCNIWQITEKSEEQSIYEIKNNLKALRKLGVKIIDFTGGEPLLYPNIIEALTLAKDYGFYTTVTTNCILYPKFALKLKGLVDVLQFSFESPTEEIHNKIRGVNCYNKVIESIHLAKEIKQKVYLIHTVTDHNIGDVPKVIAFSQKYKCILFLNPCFNYFKNEGISPKSIKILENYFYEKFVIMDVANTKLILDGGNNIYNPICKAVSSSVVISPDNYILLPCYHHYIQKIKINNDLLEIYSSEKVQRIKKKEGTYAFCRDCTIYCYMRGSLYRVLKHDFFLLSIKTGLKYLTENLRKQ